MGRVIAALFVALATAACVSGDVDEEKPLDTVPAGITPEDATFRYTSREDGGELVLEVHMSTVPLCKREAVPIGQRFVKLEIVSPTGGDIVPGRYELKQEQHTRIKLLKTTAPACASSAGPLAGDGYVDIEEVTDDVVRGSFVGTSRDSKLDLRSTFVATHCGADVDCF